jgi:hypothetical protein
MGSERILNISLLPCAILGGWFSVILSGSTLGTVRRVDSERWFILLSGFLSFSASFRRIVGDPESSPPTFQRVCPLSLVFSIILSGF